MDWITFQEVRLSKHSDFQLTQSGQRPIKLESNPTWCKFHQHFTYSFYTRRSQKRKKIQLSHKYLYTLLGSMNIKAVRKTLMKLSPGELQRIQ